MERFFFRKVEMWQMLVYLLITAILGLLYGNFVYSAVHHPPLAQTAFGRPAFFMAQLPQTIMLLQAEGDALKVGSPPEGDFTPGWDWRLAPGDAGVEGHILLSRFDGDLNRHVVDLVDLSTQETLHSWSADFTSATKVLFGTRVERFAENNWTTERFRMIHPILTDDGGLLVKSHGSPLMKVGACGSVDWVSDAAVLHHSLEAAGDGTFWSPGIVLGPEDDPDAEQILFDHTLTRTDARGNVLFERSVADLLVDSGYEWLIRPFSNFAADPVHLNDIQPVPGDGPHWRAGDVFVSARTWSLVFLYRPSEDRIIWAKHGPWTAQHDVEILDENRIGIFNNNTTSYGREHINDGLELMVYDFRTDEVSLIFQDAVEALGLESLTEGLFDLMPGGGVMIEAEATARLVVLNGDEELVGEFVNLYQDGYYHLGWSRYLPPGSASAGIAAATGAGCNS